jgi:phosphoenolpyruvate carboxykinase (GTP)
VFYAASIESEPTAATVGASSTKVIINPMANTEFVSIPLGQYLGNHIRFAEGLKHTPKIFYVNYFLRDDAGEFMNTKMDKKVWIRWIERRMRGKVGAHATPTGFLPRFEDLAYLFKRELDRDYSKDQYELHFMTRVPELLEKLDIVEKFYQKETSDVPTEIFDMIRAQRDLLVEVQKAHGDNISPFKFDNYEVPVSLRQPY